MTANRILRLLSLLQSRREWRGPELVEQLGVTDRTLRRDIGRLRELGYPVESTTGAAGGYRLASGRNLPPLILDDEEAVAIAVGLLTAADGGVSGIAESSVRALAKLEQVLPARLRPRVEAVGRATVPVHRDGPRVDPHVLAVLGTASRDQELVTFDYRDRRGGASLRRVEPHHLVASHGLWYLVAYDPDRDDWRTFRIDRISDPRTTRRRFTPKQLSEPASEYVARGIARASYRYAATARVRASVETIDARIGSLIPWRVTAIDDNTCEVHLSSDSAEEIARDLLAMGAEFHLDKACDELREHLDRAGRRLLAAHD